MAGNPYDQFDPTPNPYDRLVAEPATRPTRTTRGALMEGLNAAGPQAKRWMGKLDLNPANIPEHAMNLGTALAGLPKAMGDIAGGVVQQIREISPDESGTSGPARGVGPPINKAPAIAAETAFYNRYGAMPGPQRDKPAFNKQNALNTISTDPIGSIVDVGSAAIGGGGLALKGGKAAMEAVDLAAALAAARKAQGAVGGVIAAPFKAAGRVLDAGATPAAEAVRLSALAKALAQRQALQKSKTTVTNLKAADVPLRKKMTDEASAQAAKGIGVSDIPEAQTFVTDLQTKLNPTGTVVTNPSVGQINLYKDIINTLAPIKGKKLPSLEQVQELRRKIAKPAFGDLEGYGAIDKIERQSLVKSLNEIENAYTGGLQAPVQANYTNLIAAQKETKRLEKFAPDIDQAISKLEKLPPQESIKVAKSIVDKMQKRTSMPKVEYDEFIDLATAATDAKGKSAFRKKLALYGAGLIGISATGGTIAGQATGILP